MVQWTQSQPRDIEPTYRDVEPTPETWRQPQRCGANLYRQRANVREVELTYRETEPTYRDIEPMRGTWSQLQGYAMLPAGSLWRCTRRGMDFPNPGSAGDQHSLGWLSQACDGGSFIGETMSPGQCPANTNMCLAYLCPEHALSCTYSICPNRNTILQELNTNPNPYSFRKT